MGSQPLPAAGMSSVGIGRDTSLSTRYFNSHNLVPKFDELYFTFETHKSDMNYCVHCGVWLCEEMPNYEINWYPRLQPIL